MLNNILKPAVAKELANIREKIENVKRDISNFVDIKDSAMVTRANDIENATCEQSTIVESRLADIENALCDLSEVLSTE